MTISGQPGATLIGIPDIAEIAGVQRTAVSNWRKRDADFPAPVVETPSGLLFDLTDIERWLIEKGKIDQRVPISAFLWRSADALRGELTVEEFGRFIGSVLVYLEVCDRAGHRASGIRALQPRDAWKSIREADPGQVLGRLQAAGRRIESKNQNLAGLIVDGFTPLRDPAPASVLAFVDLLCRATSEDGTPRFTLFEETRDRVHGLARFSEEFATPGSLESLLARLTTDASTIFDPACGEGGALLMAGLVDGRDASLGSPILYGWDVNAEACRLARTRFFLYDIDAEIHCGNSLRELDAPSGVDAVILDPPFAMREWGDADLYVSDRWTFGSPPPGSADMAWLQLSLARLSSDGRAFVFLPEGSLYRSGSEQRIRRAMIEAGVIESIVLLPARLRRDTSIPLVLWCLRPTGARQPGADVLLADASNMGTANRSTVEIDEPEIDSIVSLIQTWSSEGRVQIGDPRIHAASVAVSNIEGDNLDPAKYHPIELADVEVLAVAREEAFRELQAVELQVRAAMSDLVASLETDQP